MVKPAGAPKVYGENLNWFFSAINSSSGILRYIVLEITYDDGTSSKGNSGQYNYDNECFTWQTPSIQTNSTKNAIAKIAVKGHVGNDEKVLFEWNDPQITPGETVAFNVRICPSYQVAQQ